MPYIVGMRRSARSVYFGAILLGLALIACTPPGPPQLRIEMAQPVSYDAKQPCVVHYTEGRRTVALPARIKARGGYSRRYPKRSYALELAEKHPLAGITRDDDWILNANYIDKTFVRHVLSYGLYRAMHPDNRAARTAYVTLAWNDEPRGLYVLMEELNGGALDLVKADTAAALFKDPPIFRAQLPPVRDSLSPFHQKYPKPHRADRSAALHAFRRFLTRSDDVTFLARVGDYIDRRQVLDWHLLLLLTNNSDGILKNFYLYRTHSDAPYRIAIWDYDHSFGRDGDGERNRLERNVDARRSLLFRRLLDAEGSTYPAELRERYVELRRSGLFSLTGIQQRINTYLAPLGPTLRANAHRWPLDSDNYYDADTHAQEVAFLYEVVALQLARLDERFGYGE